MALEQRSQRIIHGALAGVVGTAALKTWEQFGRSRPLPFAPDALVRRFARQQLHRRVSKTTSRRLGSVARWIYGPTWGVGYALLARTPPRAWWRQGLLLGAALGLFELTVLPTLDATPPVRRWPHGAVGQLALQVGIYGLVTALSLNPASPAAARR